ncbi:glucosaminidase domain-containing protein [Thiotrichales bacterium 19S3-7]|nr:glucosaminidase domain-containing protein [Thiotrichales bacterium 19S3-7]MCF6802833.1 glucosaminidase domain-containing protein [Thiotrichales bacterium 19S3-11]
MAIQKYLKFIFIINILLFSSLFLSSCSKEESKPDFKSIDSISERKSTFIDFMLPLIHSVQQDVLSDRKTLHNIQTQYNQRHTLSNHNIKTLKKLSKQYRVTFDTKTLKSTINQLLVKVNTIPTSMVLAQAALESGWGTSRFAIYGNNYFGQHCFVSGCGMVPKKRAEGKINEVEVFDSPEDSVKAYFRLLNTGSKFGQFRQLRANLVKDNQPLTGKELIKTLVHYSELDNGEYEKRLLLTIDYNNLYEFG